MRVLAPLRHRDFFLLWLGKSVSLIGDGMFIVAVAFQAYELSNSPAALSAVGLAWTLPTVVALPLTGVLSDRVGRRPMMICADLLRAAAVGTIAALSASGRLELWHLIALAAVFGLGDALFEPSFTAIVPEIVPQELIVQANSIDQTMRPLGMQFAGPALGGIVASWSVAGAFALDAASFLFSTLTLALLHTRRTAPPEEPASVVADLREGARYVRGQAWLWGTLVAFSITLLAFWGPYDVLLPYVIKNDLDGGAGGFGVVLAAGGAGAITAAVVLGQFGLPRWRFMLMYGAFVVAMYGMVLYAAASAIWQMALIAAGEGACFAIGMVVWGTLMQTLVPARLRGRVTSLDWMASTALVPLSFALVGPLSNLIGARETLFVAGITSGSVLVVFYLALPALRDVDRRSELAGDGRGALGSAD